MGQPQRQPNLPADETADAAAGRDLVVLSGPSGVGKTTVCRAIVQRLGLRLSTSATTRRARPGETDGVEYRFLGEEEFRRRVVEGRFVEWAEVHGRLYGTPVEELDRAREEGRTLLLEIDVQGGIQIKRRYPAALAILLLPPDGRALRDRLGKRGTETAEEFERRLAKAQEEIAMARASASYDAEVVNDDLPRAIDTVVSLIQTWRMKRD